MDQWCGTIKKVFSDKAASIFISLFSKCPSHPLFLSSGISKKRLLDKAFDFDS